MGANAGLPAVSLIPMSAPFYWLAGAWSDLWRAPVPLLAYGFLISAASLALAAGIYVTNAAFWTVALTFGFVFVAPLLAMGPYDAARRLEAGETPRLGQILLVRSAVRNDVACLGLALLVVYSLWGQFAQIVYGLSTYQIHRTIPEFVRFALTTDDGRQMLIVGSGVGGAVALLTYTLVAVSAPMLLDPRTSVFEAVATSFRAVTGNPGPMLLWALILALLVGLSAVTGFVAMVVIFPWLGLASWRAYRTLVVDLEQNRAALQRAA